jgi:YVTN family beta-propeller protein
MTIRTLVLGLAGCAAVLAQVVSQQVAAGPGPMAVAVDESRNRAYLVNHNNGTVTVIDGKTRAAVATVKTGSGPEGIAVNPANGRVYVACAGDGAVTVMDGPAGTVVENVKVGSYPQAVAVNPVTNRIYVANNYAHSVSIVDGATHAVATVRVGQGPRGIVVNPATNKVYTANYGSKDVSEIDGATNAVTSIPAGKHPWTLTVDTRANRVYVVNEDSASITMIDGATRATRTVGVGEIPFAIAVNPAVNKVYVLSYATDTMAAVDGTTGAVVKTVQLDTHPSAIAVNPKTGSIYVARQTAGGVSVFDGRSYAPLARVGAGSIPYAMAVDSTANQVYVANLLGEDATVIHGDAPASAWPKPPRFRVLALAERASGDHQKFVDAARVQLDRLAAEHDFAVDYLTGTERINEEYLAQHKLFVQLNYPPYRWAPVAKKAFEEYIAQGRGGWVGFHHASLLGDFDGYPMDPWFSQFLGGIRFTHYLPDFAKATVRIEDRSHPLAKGLPASFVIDKEEWYTWSASPRPNVNVLATVDESSYVPDTMIKMGGDHPVVWSNPHYKARNVYVFMGHHAGLFDSPEFLQLFRNAILWGAGE